METEERGTERMVVFPADAVSTTMNLGGPTDTGVLGSVANRAGKNDIVHDALGASRQGKFPTMAGRRPSMEAHPPMAS